MPVFDILLTLVCICAIILLWSALFDSNRFVIQKHQITDNKIKKQFRAIVLADLHNANFGVDNSKLLTAIETLKPDVLLIPGDMITAKAKDGKSRAMKLLETLSAEYPIYYSCGNHEARIFNMSCYQRKGEEYGSFLKKAGIVLLRNETASLTECGVNIAGLEIGEEYFGRLKREKMSGEYLHSELGEKDNSLYTILLAHNPDYFAEYSLWKPELVISGHNHGGIVRIPFWGKGVISPAAQLFPKYDGGVFEENGSKMILSRGLGIHTIPFRIFNPGEIWVIDFAPGEALENAGENS